MKLRNSVLAILCVLCIPVVSFAKGLDETIDEWFSPIASAWEGLVFTTVPVGSMDVPFVVILLVGGATFFTLYFGFINVRKFPLAINVVRGKYDDLEGGSEPVKTDSAQIIDGDIVDTIRVEGKAGEVSHFQALATAVSGTVGLGNIAGVAVAIAVGGPGATFWMIVCGLLGMSSKFVECTLGVKYRDVGPDGTVYGGPMYYLKKGLNERGYAGIGKALAIIFAVFCVGASFGGGNAFQSNQATIQLISLFGFSGGAIKTVIGVIMAALL